MKYFLNTGTGKLHIEGFCYHAMTKPFNGMEFETEDEARRYAGDNLTWCKICERRKEQIFENICTFKNINGIIGVKHQKCGKISLMNEEK